MAEILPYLDHLEDNLDNLGECLNAFLPNDSLGATAKKLPLLDRAKLHVTVVYAIESLIFSYLRLHNLSPHAHPVFKELARVKSYFDKIRDVENAPAAARKKPDAALDKNAAERREAEAKVNSSGGARAGETPQQAKKKRKHSSITDTDTRAGAGAAGPTGSD
ncbi:hypothetical protein DV736_g6289, partial [Chaetothyriales sp. CBS 134916]